MAPPDRPPEPSSAVRLLWEQGHREEAYAQVVEVTQDALYRYLISLLRDEESARDVFQETYLRVFRALGGFRGEAQLTTWVLRIGRNLALNRLRDRKGRSSREVPVENLDLPSESRIEGDVATTRALRRAMGALPDIQREAAWLYYGEQFSVAEVAAATGRPANTVKSDLRRARHALRNALGWQEAETAAPAVEETRT